MSYHRSPHHTMAPELNRPAGAFRIAVRAAGYRPVTLGPFAPETELDVLTATLVAAPQIEGLVHTGFQGVGDAKIEAFTLAPSPDGASLARDFSRVKRSGKTSAQSDQRGWFEMDRPEGEAFALKVTAPGIAPAWKFVEENEVTGDRTKVGMLLRPGGSITGRVVAHDGPPAPGTLVSLVLPDGTHRRMNADGEGAFLFDLVPAGDAWLRLPAEEPYEWVWDPRRRGAGGRHALSGATRPHERGGAAAPRAGVVGLPDHDRRSLGRGMDGGAHGFGPGASYAERGRALAARR